MGFSAHGRHTKWEIRRNFFRRKKQTLNLNLFDRWFVGLRTRGLAAVHWTRNVFCRRCRINSRPKSQYVFTWKHWNKFASFKTVSRVCWKRWCWNSSCRWVELIFSFHSSPGGAVAGRLCASLIGAYLCGWRLWRDRVTRACRAKSNASVRMATKSNRCWRKLVGAR